MSESGDPQPPARHQHASATRPSEPEHLPCPRCDSINTKFCYYNNYNLSQPRHFCKSCRRYWTRGGTLRNVPPGGGTRKNSNKRSRTSTTAAASSSSSTVTFDPINSNLVQPVSVTKSEPISVSGCSSIFGEVNLNEAVVSGGFSTLLGSQQWDGFGLGLGSGLHGLGFGINAWENLPSEQPGEGNPGGCGGASGGGGAPGCNTWQIGGVEGGLSDGDCFGWPDLSISTPGKSLK